MLKPASSSLRPFKPSAPTFTLAASFDIESKKPNSEEQGFERPFLVGTAFEGKYKAFFDDEGVNRKNVERAFGPGGCVHEFFRWLTESPEGRRLQARPTKTRRRGMPPVKNPPVIFYGHNAGGFDALHFLRHLRRVSSSYSLKLVASGSQLLELRVEERTPKNGKKPRVWVFRDSMRLVPGSLDSIGKKLLLSTRKVKMEGGMSAPESRRREWEAYNRADCETVVALVTKLHALLSELGGHLKMTTPACAMDLFRRVHLGPFLRAETLPNGKPNPLFGRSGIPRERHFPSCPSLCRKCRRETCWKDCPRRAEVRPACPAAPYGCLHAWLAISPTGARHGGRTEVFVHRHRPEIHGRLRYFDRNSSYAAAMTEDLPVKLAKHFGPGKGPQTWDGLEDYGEMFAGFVECVVEIPETCNVPPLPIVHDDKLVFPTGTLYGRWDWTELRHVADVGGRILHVHESVWYHKAPFIRPMMEALFSIRAKAKKDGNEPLAEVCKLLCNALYGKFIQSPERDELFTATPGEEPDGAELVCPEALATCPKDEPLLWRKAKYAEADYFLPHVGSHITALAREALWKKAQEIESQGGILFYTDTDSVVFSGADLASSDVLGEWKEEHGRAEMLTGEFDSPKSYRLRELGSIGLDKVHEPGCESNKCKGCGKVLVHLKGLHRSKHTSENFEKLRAGETISVPDQPPKLGEMLRTDFRRYETKDRKKRNLRWRDGLDEEIEIEGKRRRKGDRTWPLVFGPRTPTTYVESGRAFECTQQEIFAHYDRAARMKRTG